MRYRVYLKPFDDVGVYVDDFLDITDDVVNVSDVSQKIDSSEFDVGVIRNNGLTITLRNDGAKYSDPTNIKSIFKTKRKNSIIKITWAPYDEPPICGFAICGSSVISDELTVFEGLLNEITSTTNIQKQQITFSILGYESLLDEIETPYADISNGDFLSDTIYAMLNQSPFNSLVTVNLSNIVLSLDVTIDDVSSLENTTVGDSIKNMLLASNSVLYIKNNILYVTAREESVDLKYTFYGQGSTLGIENILNIPKYKEGLNRTFNFWTWANTTIVVKDVSSIDTYGVLQKQIDLSLITDTTKRTNLLTVNKNEFRTPTPELDLITPITVDTIALNILDKVNIDYPNVYTPSDNNPLPRYGQVQYGSSRYPYGEFSLTIETERNFKILGKKMNKRNNTITFSLREVL